MFISVALLASTALAQEFEAVSVRPNNSGGFDSHSHSDQGLLKDTNVTLRSLIATAYQIRDYQLEGPDWMGSERFDVAAKFPEALPKGRERYEAAMGTMMRKMRADSMLSLLKIAIRLGLMPLSKTARSSAQPLHTEAVKRISSRTGSHGVSLDVLPFSYTRV